MQQQKERNQTVADIGRRRPDQFYFGELAQRWVTIKPALMLAVVSLERISESGDGARNQSRLRIASRQA
jgi:hypothetical protein